MTDFIPYEYKIRRPNMMPGTSSGTDGSAAPQLVFDSIILPLAVTIDLATIAGPGVTGTPGTVYERDYFLFHQEDYAVQSVWISTDEDTAQTDFAVQLVSEATELSEERTYQTLPQTPDNFPATIIGDSGPIYLRVRAAYQSTPLYVTIELLTSKVSP